MLALWALISTTAGIALACTGSRSTAEGGLDGATPTMDGGHPARDATPAADVDSPDGQAVDDGGACPGGDLFMTAMPPSFTNGGRHVFEDGTEIFDASKAFYEDNADAFDMLIIFSDVQMEGTFAFSIPLNHAIEGIGLREAMARFGWGAYGPWLAGSESRLQHVVFMNAPATYARAAYTAQEILTHEVGHRWSAYVQLPDAEDNGVLVDEWWSHWTLFASLGGPSALGYGELVEEAPGHFRFSIRHPLRYAQLELYQQGLIARDEVGPMFYVENAAGFAPPASRAGPWTPDAVGESVSFEGSRVDFTIDDVVGSHGARVPDAAGAQRAFRMAFMLVCADPSSCAPDAIPFVEAQRRAWPETFAMATGGRATVDVSLCGN